MYELWCEWALLEGWCSEVVGAAAAVAVACVVFAAAPAAAVGTVSSPAMSSAGPVRKLMVWLNKVPALNIPARLKVYSHQKQSLLVDKSLLLFSQLLRVDGWRTSGHGRLWHYAWHHHSYGKDFKKQHFLKYTIFAKDFTKVHFI